MRFNRFFTVLLMLTMIFSTAMPAFVSGAEKVEFKDTHNSYAMKEIDALLEAGIISGYEDGTFQPMKAMTRAELAKILVLSLGAKEDPMKAEAFLDVEADSWYRGYVGALVASGITQGTSLTTFSPDANVTREELVVFFIRALGLEKTAATLPIVDTFSDKDQIADWARSQVSFATQIGFVQGTEGPDNSLSFNPKEDAERQALARLAFEFRTNASLYVEKAMALGDRQKDSIISSIVTVSNTSIEVIFSSELTSVSRSDFAFDNNLQVVDAAFKAGSKSIVVLTTSAQTKDVAYKLTFKGTSMDTSVLGVAASGFFGGGGGGGGGFVANPTVEQQLASGTALGTITVKASGTYGPASGSATTVQNLIIDPGPTGEVRLRNINALKLEILSGDVNSIKLQNTIIKQMHVNAVNNGGKSVRIEVRDGATIEDTEVSSQAVLESSSLQGTLGKIKLASSAGGKQITLKGHIEGEVTVEAPGVEIKLDEPSNGNSLPTVVKSLKLKSSANITAAAGTVTEGIYVAAPNTTLILDGPGELENVELPSSSTGTSIEFKAGANLQKITAGVNVTVTGDPEAIGKVSSENGVMQMSDELKLQVKAEAIKLANEAIQKSVITSGYDTQKASIEAAERAIAIAKKYEALDADFAYINQYQSVKKFIFEFRDQIEGFQLQFQGGDSADSVTQRPTFPPTDGTFAAVWNSDQSEFLSPWGPFERPASGAGDVTAVLTVTFYKAAYSATKTIIVKVKQYDSKVVAATSLRSDLVLIEFDHPVINSKATEFQFDNGLKVISATQYPQLKQYVLLSVQGQLSDTMYKMSYKQATADKIVLTGSVKDTCSSSTCPMPYPAPVSEIPIPGVIVPGIVAGYIFENTETSGLEPLSNVKVTLIGTDRTVQTDVNGYYRFNQVSAGIAYSVQASKTGYSMRTTNNFTIASGEPYLVEPITLHTAPKQVKELKTINVNATRVELYWMPNPGDFINSPTYKIFQDEKEIINTEVPFYAVENLQSGKIYTFAVVACNDVGCAAPTTISVRTPTVLRIDQIRPYNSVTKEVYNPLTKTETDVDRYQIPKASNAADYLLVSLKDSDYVPDTGTGLLKGALDISEAKVALVYSSIEVTGKLESIGGVSYYKISFYNQPVSMINANEYYIYGLKYVVNGQTHQVEPLLYAITFE